jgi:hypothetical protein
MKLVVCGCSWSSRDPNNLDTEYGYYISKHFDGIIKILPDLLVIILV